LKHTCFVPLATARETLGFFLLNRWSPAPFTPDEMNWSSQAAAQIAVALENALAFREIAALKDRLARENIYLEEEIRERRRAEAELQQARSALAQRQRVSLLGEVAASLTHEIKQPRLRCTGTTRRSASVWTSTP
jgi:formate hydrogenlyase transcriptional activator